MIHFLTICLIVGSVFLSSAVEEKLIIIVVPSYNNIKFYEKNLDSIRLQIYDNYRVLYIDDCSVDGTSQAVEEYIHKWNLQERVHLVKNKIRRGAMYNHYMAAHCCPNHAIIVTLDGDDWFPDNTMILKRINEVYQDPNIWMTYGQFQEYPSGQKGFCAPVPTIITKLHAYRDYSWITSHLRTYYAGLFKEIPLGYFVKNGSFLKSTSDLAIMFALLELSGGRAFFIEDIMYIYNTTNENSDFRTRVLEQLNNNYWVRSRRPLTALTARSWESAMKSYDYGVYNLHISLQGATACHDYLETISHTDIQKEHMHVWYRRSCQQDDAMYKALSTEFGIAVQPIDLNTDFKTQIVTYLTTISTDAYVLITTDRCSWSRAWSGAETVDMLTETKALSYHCIRGVVPIQADTMFVSTHDIPAFVPVTESFCIWKYTEAAGYWHMPYYSNGLVIKASALQEIVERVKGVDVEQLFYNLSLLVPRNLDDVGLCSFVAPCRMLSDNHVLCS